MSDQSHPGGPPTTPPGWYPDGQGGQRWWDGTAWTEHTIPPPPPAAPPQSQAPQQGGHPPAQQGGYPTRQQWQPASGGYPQQYGQPPQYGQQPRSGGRSGKLLAVLGGAAALVVAVVVVLVVVVGGGGGGDPEGVVEDFLSAADDGDCDALKDLVTDEFAEAFGDCEAADLDSRMGENTEVDYDIGEAEVDDGDDAATVKVDVSVQGSDDQGFETTQTFELVKDGGDWRIHSFS